VIVDEDLLDFPRVIHTAQDSLDSYGDEYDFEHMLEFVKLVGN
jgi:hypothetical protein